MNTLPRDQVSSVDQVSLPISSLAALIILLLLILFFSLVGTGITFVLGSVQGVNYNDIFNALSSESPIEHRNFMRSALLVNHLFMFALPAICFGWMMYRQKGLHFFSLNRWPSFHLSTLSIFWILFSFPLVQLTFWLNQQLPLPSWAINMEDSTNNLISGLMVTDGSLELIFNLLVIAVLPGIGEELIFRGIFQQHLAKITKSMHAGIWSSAILFSAMHLQFEGFLPRMMLGLMLGYLFYWTANLWLPIIAHLFYNGIQVIGYFLYADQLPELDIQEAQPSSWPITLISLIFVLVLAYYFRKMGREQLSEQHH